MDPKRLRRLANDRIDAINATVERWTRAYHQTHIPSRKPSRAGRVSGHGDRTYSDPVGQTAAILLDELDAIGTEMLHRREDDWRLAGRLADFAAARQWDDSVRRCTEDGCARKHYALGLCEPHYRRAKRVEQRRTAG